VGTSSGSDAGGLLRSALGNELANLSNVELFIQAAIAVFVIVNPVDPVKVIIFNDVVERQGLNRNAAAAKVAVVVFCILGVIALIGRELLQLLGINLGAFGVVGGLVVALMGFEMLYGGTSSRAQGTKEAEDTPVEEDGLIMPLAVPLMAGPGAMTTVITISAIRDDGSSLIAALVAVAVVSVLVFVGFAWLGDLFSRMSTNATAMLARVGGVLLATIGTQLLLGGLRTFYEG
jgi:multiple antibiotic resistance protein